MTQTQQFIHLTQSTATQRQPQNALKIQLLAGVWPMWNTQPTKSRYLRFVQLTYKVLTKFYCNYSLVRNRLRSFGPKEIRRRCRSVSRWFGGWRHQGTRGEIRLFVLQRQAVRPGQLGWWWGIYLPQRRGLLTSSACKEHGRWMARHCPGQRLANLHPDSADRDLLVPWSRLPYVGPLPLQQVPSEAHRPPYALLRSLRCIQGLIHRHLQDAFGLLLSHPHQGLN